MLEGAASDFQVNYSYNGTLTPIRICVYRKTSEQATNSERQIKKSNKKKGRTKPSEAQLFYGNYVIVATSLPYESDKILELYRQRWQIEILFKRLKSLFHYDDMPARTERTMKAFISGKLLLAAICETLVTQGRFSP
jgi:IS4 transposase